MNQPGHILVVDDVAKNVTLLRDILEAKGYKVSTASSGTEALEKIRTDPPNLVLLDVIMPDLSGFEVCKRVRDNSDTALLPVVLVTALDSTEDRIRGIEAGADDFLTKPIDLHELLARVRSLLRIEELIETVERQAAELEQWNKTLEEKVQKQVDQLDRLNRLRRLLSPQVADIIVSSGSDSVLASHRREIATIFCDLRGFTSFAKDVEPEEAMDVLGRYHEEMGQLIHEAEGTIEHRAGDGIMIIFNDPIPCDHPALRAVRLAVKMRERMNLMISEWGDMGYELGFGVGVTFGYATLGLVGYEGRFDYTANGTVVNLASRLCDEAVDNQILITQKVLAMVKDTVEATPLKPLNLKGISDPVTSYDVVRFQD